MNMLCIFVRDDGDLEYLCIAVFRGLRARIGLRKLNLQQDYTARSSKSQREVKIVTRSWTTWDIRESNIKVWGTFRRNKFDLLYIEFLEEDSSLLRQTCTTINGCWVLKSGFPKLKSETMTHTENDMTHRMNRYPRLLMPGLSWSRGSPFATDAKDSGVDFLRKSLSVVKDCSETIFWTIAADILVKEDNQPRQTEETQSKRTFSLLDVRAVVMILFGAS